MILYFARHGESTANTLRVISNRELNHPLTDLGRDQAALLAEKLRPAGLTAVFTSPVPRALETAMIVSRRLALPLETADGLREFDTGVLEGRSGFFAWLRFSRLWNQWFVRQHLNKRIRGGESFLEARQRFSAFIQQLAGRYSESGCRLLCIAHGGILWVGLSGLMEILTFDNVSSGPIPYTALISAEYRNGKLTCNRWEGVTLPRAD